MNTSHANQNRSASAYLLYQSFTDAVSDSDLTAYLETIEEDHPKKRATVLRQKFKVAVAAAVAVAAVAIAAVTLLPTFLKTTTPPPEPGVWGNAMQAFVTDCDESHSGEIKIEYVLENIRFQDADVSQSKEIEFAGMHLKGEYGYSVELAKEGGAIQHQYRCDPNENTIFFTDESGEKLVYYMSFEAIPSDEEVRKMTLLTESECEENMKNILHAQDIPLEEYSLVYTNRMTWEGDDGEDLGVRSYTWKYARYLGEQQTGEYVYLSYANTGTVISYAEHLIGAFKNFTMEDFPYDEAMLTVTEKALASFPAIKDGRYENTQEPVLFLDRYGNPMMFYEGKIFNSTEEGLLRMILIFEKNQ